MFYILWIITFSVLYALAEADGLWQPFDVPPEPSQTRLRKLDDGLLVSKGADLLIQEATWKVVVTLDVPRLPDALGHHLKALEDALNKLLGIGSRFTPFTALEQLSWKTRLDRVKLRLGDDYLHGSRHHLRMRNKRGLLNFIGILSHHLFGTATSAEVRKTRELLIKVNNNNNAVNHLVHELASVVNQSHVYINENRDKINALTKYTKSLVQNLERFAGGLQSALNKNTQKHQAERLVEDAEIIADAFVFDVERYHRQRTALESGILTEDLLSGPILTDIMMKAKAHQKTVIPNIEWYYQFVPVKPMWGDDNTVIFQLELPLVKPIRYVHYWLETFPVPQGEGTVSTLEVNADIAAENSTGTLVVPRKCRGYEPIVCGPSPMRSGVAMACERGVLTNNQTDRQKCVVKVERTTQVDQIWFVDENQVVLSTWGDTVYQKCEDKHPEMKRWMDKGVYVFNLTDLCVYRGSTWEVSYSPVHTQTMYIERQPLPDIPPLIIPEFLNSTGWKIRGLDDLHELGDMKQFTLKTLNDFHEFTIPPYKKGWLWGTFVVIIIVIAMSLFLVYYLRKYYSVAAKGENAEAVDEPIQLRVVNTRGEEPMEIDLPEGSVPQNSSMEGPVIVPGPSIAEKGQNLKLLFNTLLRD